VAGLVAAMSVIEIDCVKILRRVLVRDEQRIVKSDIG